MHISCIVGGLGGQYGLGDDALHLKFIVSSLLFFQEDTSITEYICSSG